ncbi:MAG: inositol monophosphatase family protein, partial [Bdellovibrionota bacterium]
MLNKGLSLTPAEKREIAALEKLVIRAARTAGLILTRYFQRREYHVRSKGAAGLVTDADLAAEAAVIKILRAGRPHFAFLTEEGLAKNLRPTADPSFGRTSGRWIVDPLDGTTNFVHGFPMFCVSIGAEWQGRVVAGAIYHPVLREMYHAREGGGAWLGGKKRLHVSKTKQVADALLTTGFTYQKRKHLNVEMNAFRALSSRARAVRRPGSAALDLAYTARGVFDGFWERRLNPWDVAAGGIIVQEAGGVVTDFSGRPFHP